MPSTVFTGGAKRFDELEDIITGDILRHDINKIGVSRTSVGLNLSVIAPVVEFHDALVVQLLKNDNLFLDLFLVVFQELFLNNLDRH